MPDPGDTPTVNERPPRAGTDAGGEAPARAADAGAPAAGAGDRYDRGAEIARGGMGRVIEARDRLLGRTVAIKEALDADPFTRGRFEREVRITARLEHPSIVPVHDAGVSASGDPFYVMRRVSGRPLDQLIADARTLDERLTLLPHMLAVVDAVAHAHQRGVVHRDLKPANVLVGEHGETVVIDWGLAKVLDEDDADAAAPGRAAAAGLHTRAGEVFGTPGFMAPEQALADTVDARTDVFALGACLYHLLAGVPPFHGRSTTEVLDRTVAQTPTALPDLIPGVPPDLVTIVATAMAREPANRYPDAARLREDLRRFLSGQLVASHHYSPGQRVGRTLRRHRGVIAVTALAAAVLIVFGVLSLRRIFADRDRLAAARNAAEAALVRERARADELVVSQAAFYLPTDPTLAVATLKQLAPDSPAWDRARAIALEAKFAGIAVGYPSSGGEHARASLAPDGRLVTTARSTVLLHDLNARTTITVADGAAGSRIPLLYWAGPVVVWREDTPAKGELHVFDPRDGGHRVVPWAGSVEGYTAAEDGVIVFHDRDSHLLAYDAAAGADAVPTPIVTDHTKVSAQYLSPSGAYLIVTSDDRSTVMARSGRLRWTAIARRPRELALPTFTADESQVAAWESPLPNGTAAWPDTVELGLTSSAATELRRWREARLMDLQYAGHELMGIDQTNRLVHLRGDRIERDQAFERSTGGRISPMSDGFAVLDADNTIVVIRGEQRWEIRPPLHVDELVASRRGHHLVALARSEVLVWDLDEVLPMTVHGIGGQSLVAFLDDRTVLTTRPTATPGPSGETLLVVESHDVVTGAPGPSAEIPLTFDWTELGAGVLAWGLASRPIWIGPGLASQVPLAASDVFYVGAYDADHFLVAQRDGAVRLIDARTGAGVDVVRVPGVAMLGSIGEWIGYATDTELRRQRGRHAGEVVRLDRPLTTLAIGGDGTIYTADGRVLEVWPPGADARSPLLTLPLAVDQLSTCTRGRLVAVTADQGLQLVDPVTRRTRPVLPASQFRPVLTSSGRTAVGLVDDTPVVGDLVGEQTWRLPRITNAGMVHAATSPDGATVAMLAEYNDDRALLWWRIGLPRGGELARWVRTATNAVAPTGVIEWQ